MRIREDIPDSAVDSSGNAIVTSFTILSAVASEQPEGRMGTGEVGYAQGDLHGNMPDGSNAEWNQSLYGEATTFPDRAVVLLTMNELSLCSPGVPGEGPELNLIWKYELVKAPSDTYGSEPGIVLPWRAYPEGAVSRGLLAEITDVFPVLGIEDGCIWVALPGGVTAIDFATDIATIYQSDGARLYQGLDTSSIPDDPYGSLDPELALPHAPYRSVATFSTRSHSWVAVGGGSGVSILRKDFSLSRSLYSPVEHVDLGFEVNDVHVFRNGAVLAVGTEIGDTPGVGDLRWAWRYSVRGDAFGDAAWGEAQSSLHDFSQPLPRISRDGRWVWMSGGAGNVFRFELPEVELTADLSVATSAEVQYWAGPAELTPGGDPPPAEPRYTSIDSCALISNLTFDNGFPVVMLQLLPEQNSGSLMCVYDKRMRQALYRRRHRTTQTGVISLPFVTPGSRPVEPGHTKDPAVGYGPSDPELA